jgi:hypothetical protein
MPDHEHMWFLLTDTGRRVTIPRLPASIGSGDAADVVLRAPSVQPVHAWLRPGAATGLRLEVCKDSTVEIDGWAVQQADLHIGDELLVGSLRVLVGRGQPAAGSTTARTRRQTGRVALAGRPQGSADGRGLLHADLGQLSVGTRCLLGLVLVLLAAAIVWAAQALVVLLA